MSYGTDRHRRTLEDVNDAAENRRTRSEVRNKWTQTRREEEEDEFHQMVEEHLQEQDAGEAERERRANDDASSTECG